MDRRRVLALGGAVGLVALAGCAPRDGSSAARPGPTPDPGPTPRAVPAPPTPAPSTPWSVLRPYAAFGWLPPGFAPELIRSGPDGLELRHGVPGHPSRTWPDITLEMWRADAQPWTSADRPEVAGDGRALWRPTAHGHGILEWQHADRAWAVLRVTDVDGDALAVARRVAGSLRYGAGTALRLPWRLPELPDGLAPWGAQVVRRHPETHQPWAAELSFAGPEPGGVGVTGPQLPPVMLAFGAHQGPESAGPADPPQPDRVVAGLPALLREDAYGQSLSLYRPDDIVHSVNATNAALTRLGPRSLIGFAESCDYLGDPPTWTDRPVG